MKKLFALLLFAASSAFAAPYDIGVDQRSPTDMSWQRRLMDSPSTDGIFIYNVTTKLPEWVTLGANVAITSGVLNSALVQPDWAATSGYAAILNKPTSFPPAAHTHDASDVVSGVLADARIPSLAISKTTGLQTALDGKFQNPSGTTAQYLRGNGSLATFPTAVSSFTNDSSYVTSSSLTTTLASYATTSALTTGLAGKFNTPAGTTSQYVRGDGSLATLPTTPAASQASASRSLNTAFQVSTTRSALVMYSVQITATASIAGGQNGDVVLEIASDSGFTANVQTVSIAGLGQTYTLAVAIQGVQPQTSVVSGFVPAGYYARLRTVNNTGTPTFTYRAGQEVLL